MLLIGSILVSKTRGRGSSPLGFATRGRSSLKVGRTGGGRRTILCFIDKHSVLVAYWVQDDINIALAG